MGVGLSGENLSSESVGDYTFSDFVNGGKLDDKVVFIHLSSTR